MKNKSKTCRNGHLFSKENTYFNITGYRTCRKCQLANQINWQKRHPKVKIIKIKKTKDKNYRKTSEYKEIMRQATANWAKRNIKKAKAHKQLRNEIKQGRIIRKPCEICGKEKTDAHHADYNKPLQVMWLCRLHHKEWHRNNKAIE